MMDWKRKDAWQVYLVFYRELNDVPVNVLSAFVLLLLKGKKQAMGRTYFHPHFTDEETEEEID